MRPFQLPFLIASLLQSSKAILLLLPCKVFTINCAFLTRHGEKWTFRTLDKSTRLPEAFSFPCLKGGACSQSHIFVYEILCLSSTPPIPTYCLKQMLKAYLANTCGLSAPSEPLGELHITIRMGLELAPCVTGYKSYCIIVSLYLGVLWGLRRNQWFVLAHLVNTKHTPAHSVSKCESVSGKKK